MKLNRLFDFFFSATGIFFLFPIMLIIFIWIKLDSQGAVFFQQNRVGRDGKLFKVLKFRTMVAEAEAIGPQITAGHDPRITTCGSFLRKYKLDELPQLINVLKGEMSLVGPRPEVPSYVDKWPAHDKELILSINPGITDYASLCYSNEQAPLAQTTDPEAVYLNTIMPRKLNLYKKYVKEKKIWLDVRIFFATIAKLAGVKMDAILPELKNHKILY